MAVNNEYWLEENLSCALQSAKEITREELSETILEARQLLHQTAQPLTTILTLSELLNGRELCDESLSEDVQTIFDQAFEMKILIRQLQDLLISKS